MWGWDPVGENVKLTEYPGISQWKVGNKTTKGFHKILHMCIMIHAQMRGSRHNPRYPHKADEEGNNED